jgi:hypothetical protein
MGNSTFYFQVAFEGQETPARAKFREEGSRRSIVVEVNGQAYEDPENAEHRRSPEEAAEKIARTTANELARQELPEVAHTECVVTRLEESPPILKNVEPDIDNPEVRAWLLKS